MNTNQKIDLNGLRVAVIASDAFEEPELTDPVKALKEAGARVEIVGLERKPLQAFRHHEPTITVNPDKTIDEVRPDDYDALVLPGGALNADTIRADDRVKAFVKAMNDAHKPMAVICHAPWVLASTGIAKGRTLTSWPTIQDDLRNAGATWVDREVVVDDNLVTSRGPKDLPAFDREMLQLFAKGRRRSAAPA